MTHIKEEYAISHAIEIAKIVCANPSVKIYPNGESAKEVADFISVLADSLTGKTAQ